MNHSNIQKYRIILTYSFKHNLDNICIYLTYILIEPELAKKLQRKIAIALSSLQVFPSRHLNLNNFIKTKNQNLHRILIDNYVLIYTIDYILHEVYILHIFYANQDYFNLL